MNEELAAPHAEALGRTVGGAGRMMSLSKSGYHNRHPDHAAIFNARIALDAGVIWWGDLDVTLDEPKLAELAQRIGEIVYVLYEGDSYFPPHEKPPLERAAYSAAPSGHTRFDHHTYERAVDGTLRRRPPDPVTQRRLILTVSRPRLLRFWQLERQRTDRRQGYRRERTTLIYIGRGRRRVEMRDRSPFAVLGFFRKDGDNVQAVAFELTWYPTRKRNAPRPLLNTLLWRRHGRWRPHVTIVAHLGLVYTLTAGLERQRWVPDDEGGES